MPLFTRLRRRLFVFQIFLLLAGAVIIAYAAQRTFEHDLEPDMTRKGVVIAQTLASQFERALTHGIALSRLRGVDELFQTFRASNREILFIAAVDAAGDTRDVHAFVVGDVPRSVVLAGLPAMLRASRSGAIADGLLGAGGGHASVDRIARWQNALIARQPIWVGGERKGWVLVGIDSKFVQEQLTGLIYDILVVLAVSLLLTFELLLLIMASATTPALALQSVLHHVCSTEADIHDSLKRWPPEVARVASELQQMVAWLHSRYAALGIAASSADDRKEDHREASGDADSDLDRVNAALAALKATSTDERRREASQAALIRVRMPLFVFFLAEELSRPFFPIFARGLAGSIGGLSPVVVISLPMILFMLVVAFSQPVGGPWAERLGSRRMILAGSLLGATGLALTAVAWNFYSLLAWRFLTAIGYGLVFVAGQSHVISHTDARNRSWGIAMFVGSVLAASICGPAIGGILAERVGYNWTFAIGALTALSAGLLAWWLLRGTGERRQGQGARLRLKDVGLVLRNPRFLALVVGGAMPAKIILTGFLYYLVPLYLANLGNNSATTGRIVMLYGLMMVLATPLAARLADRLRVPMVFVVGGGVLSAAGTLGVVWSSSTAMLVVAVVALGLAQAMSITPQLALVPTACPEECGRLGQVTVIGFFRLFERIGSALGPLIAACLLQSVGYRNTAVAIGLGVASASLLLAVVWSSTTRRGPAAANEVPTAIRS